MARVSLQRELPFRGGGDHRPPRGAHQLVDGALLGQIPGGEASCVTVPEGAVTKAPEAQVSSSTKLFCALIAPNQRWSRSCCTLPARSACCILVDDVRGNEIILAIQGHAVAGQIEDEDVVGLDLAGQVPERGLKVAQRHVAIQQGGHLHRR